MLNAHAPAHAGTGTGVASQMNPGTVTVGGPAAFNPPTSSTTMASEPGPRPTSERAARRYSRVGGADSTVVLSRRCGFCARSPTDLGHISVDFNRTLVVY